MRLVREEEGGPPALIKEVLDASRVGGFHMPTLDPSWRQAFNIAYTHLEAEGRTALAAAAVATGLTYDEDLAPLLDPESLPWRKCRNVTMMMNWLRD